MKTLVLLFMCLGMNAMGQTANKIKVDVDCTCLDMVGIQYATALRDTVVRSPRFELVDSGSEGTGEDKRYNWVLRIVTIDDTVPPSHGSAAAIGVVMTLGGFVFGQNIQLCGLQRVDNCAAMTLAWMDQKIQDLAKD